MKGARVSEIRRARLRHGVGVRELGRRMGVTGAAVLQWERNEERGAVRVETIERALHELGDSLVVSSRPVDTGEAAIESREHRVALELHRAVAHKLIDEPDRVLASVPADAERIRPRLRGPLAHSWLDDWVHLAAERRIGELVAIMTGSDRRSADMRQVSPFAGVLSQEERVRAIERASA